MNNIITRAFGEGVPSLAAMLPECPVKAAAFDEQHVKPAVPARKVKNHAGAIELASQYTAGGFARYAAWRVARGGIIYNWDNSTKSYFGGRRKFGVGINVFVVKHCI